MDPENLSADEQAQFDEMRSADTPDAGAAAETEAPSTTEAETEAGDPKAQRTVPHQALHAERVEHKATKAQLAEERRRMALIEERTNLLLQRWQEQQRPAQEQPKAPEIPALDQDPAGHIVGRLSAVEQQNAARMAQLEQAYQQQAQHAQQAQFVNDIQARASAMETQFVVEQPDYHQAVEHLVQSRHRELARIGIADPVQRHQQIAQEALQIAARAMSAGENPASWIYGLAEERGWKTPGVSAVVVASPVPDPAAVEKLSRVAAGQDQSRSLNNARGSGPVPLTAQRLAEMSRADFEKAISTPEGMALLGS